MGTKNAAIVHTSLELEITALRRNNVYLQYLTLLRVKKYLIRIPKSEL